MSDENLGTMCVQSAEHFIDVYGTPPIKPGNLALVEMSRTVIALHAALDAERAASGVAMERLGQVVRERDEARREVGRYMDAVIETDAERDKMMQERDRLALDAEINYQRGGADAVVGAIAFLRDGAERARSPWPMARDAMRRALNTAADMLNEGAHLDFMEAAEAARIDPEPAAG